MLINPTVHPYPDFDAAEDAEKLRNAMKGLGTDEEEIIDILTNRSNQQRQDIAAYFKDELGRDLIDDLKSELGGNFEDVMIGMIYPPAEYLCRQMHKAMSGIGTDEKVLVEILCSNQNRVINVLVNKYEELYGRPLVEDLYGDTSGDLRRLLTVIATGNRDDTDHVFADLAREEAQELYEAGEARFGTDESVFTKIFGKENFNHLKKVFDEYRDIAGVTIEQSIRDELSGDLLDAMLTIVECVQSPQVFYAKRLHDTLHGLGTDDDTLIRIIVGRAEFDLEAIKEEYERFFDRTLRSDVEGDTRGDYKRALLGLIK